jgi:hypothetical protein
VNRVADFSYPQAFHPYPKGDDAMNTPRSTRSERGETFVRSLLAFALVMAVAWALAGGGDPSLDAGFAGLLSG